MSAVLWKATLSGHLISAGLSPSTSLEPPVIKQLMLALVLAPIHLLAPAADSWPECCHDPTVTERFLPVELINGEPLPATDVLQLVAIDKHYSFVAYYPSGEPPFNGETTLKGPIEQRRAYGRVVQSYERTVPAATERMAITDNGQAMGRIFDERIGLIPESVPPIRQACLLFAESAISMAEFFALMLEPLARGSFASPLGRNRRVRGPVAPNPGTDGRAEPCQGWLLALGSTG